MDITLQALDRIEHEPFLNFYRFLLEPMAIESPMAANMIATEDLVTLVKWCENTSIATGLLVRVG